MSLLLSNVLVTSLVRLNLTIEILYRYDSPVIQYEELKK